MNLDKLFASEFRELINYKLSILPTTERNLYRIPIPDLSRFAEKGYSLRMGRQVYIRGIREGNYAELNGKVVSYTPRPSLKKRKFDRNGWVTDANGKFIYEEVPLPRGSIAIITNTNLEVKVGYRVNEGFDFIDSQQNKAGVMYHMYLIPKKYCYEVNRCAMILSTTMPRLRYACHKVILTTGMTVYLSVIPYKPNAQVSYKILALKDSTQFAPIVQYIENYWIKENIAFNQNITSVNATAVGVGNVAWTDLGATLDCSTFEKYDPNKSLASTGDDFDISGYV